MWQIKHFSELTTDELFTIYKLRAKVFVVEQTRIYNDVDDNDLLAHHVFHVKPDGTIDAYARLFPHDDYVMFGRVVVDNSTRGTGLGKELVHQVMRACAKHYPNQDIHIEAQSYLEQFYGSFGFIPTGPEFIHESTPHIPMVYKA